MKEVIQPLRLYFLGALSWFYYSKYSLRCQYFVTYYVKKSLHEMGIAVQKIIDAIVDYQKRRNTPRFDMFYLPIFCNVVLICGFF